MSNIALLYSSNTTITCAVANLTSNATFVAGRGSTQVDNTTNVYVDAIVQGAVTVNGTTNPTANTFINIYVYGSNTSLATTNIDTLTGTDGNFTLTNTGVLYSALKLGASISVLANTLGIKYPIAPFSVAQLFGGVMPKYWGLYVAHNTGVALNATAANHDFSFNGIKYDIV